MAGGPEGKSRHPPTWSAAPPASAASRQVGRPTVSLLSCRRALVRPPKSSGTAEKPQPANAEGLLEPEQYTPGQSSCGSDGEGVSHTCSGRRCRRVEDRNCAGDTIMLTSKQPRGETGCLLPNTWFGSDAITLVVWKRSPRLQMMAREQ